MGHFLAWSLLLLGLLMGPEPSTEDAAPLVVTGTLGESVILPVKLLSGQQVESVSWTSRSERRAFASITVTETGGPDTLYQAETQYRGRVSVVGPYHSLRISNLSLEDAGPYRAHINLRHSLITHTQKYHLQVWERLTQPRVTLSSRTGENGHCVFILTCVAESRGGMVTYSWMPLGPRTVVSHRGSVLSVAVQPGDEPQAFTCTVKNPVSNSSSRLISVPHFCTGSGTLREDTDGETVIGALGELAILPLEVSAEKDVESVTWSSKGLVAVLQPGPGKQPVLVSEMKGPYSGRLSSLHHGYSLQISSLGLQDSGPYRAWIALRNSPANITKDFTLRVYERLKKPNITASSQIVRSSTCFLTLLCSLEGAGEDAQYSWDPRGPGSVVSHGGTTLSTSWRPGDKDSYHCVVNNPVSENSSSISIRPLCSASFQPCSLRKEFLFLFILGVLTIAQS
uniref:SLAM family member 9-like n=1 Tax=Jaculus jaculus TaxID=51337 RepID=UPI001E1B0FF3|nr:SLAM family member 9-like [Jaculus jaculus]